MSPAPEPPSQPGSWFQALTPPTEKAGPFQLSPLFRCSSLARPFLPGSWDACPFPHLTSSHWTFIIQVASSQRPPPPAGITRSSGPGHTVLSALNSKATESLKDGAWPLSPLFPPLLLRQAGPDRHWDTLLPGDELAPGKQISISPSAQRGPSCSHPPRVGGSLRRSQIWG